jgi:hypothetical protein
MSLNGLNRFVQKVSSTANKIGSAVDFVNNFESNIKRTIQDFTNPIKFISQNRLGNLPVGAEFNDTIRAYGSYSAASQTASEDWRVRIHLPEIDSFTSSSILAPLMISNKSMVFPTTPQILVSHTANYNTLAPVHTNYPFPTYQNSAVEDITITAEWPIENESDGRYWMASVHFLRSVTKMFYGDSPNRGSPPPLVYLSGYGDFIFNRVPCVVKLFSMDLPDAVDYIKVPVSAGSSSDRDRQGSSDSTSGAYTYVPTLSRLSVTVSPTYSRDEISKFNLDEFAKGGYIGSNKGFI